MDWLRTDPDGVLDSAEFADAEWATALAAGEPGDAIDAFVRLLRADGPRTNRQTDLAAVNARWYGKEVGRSGGHRLDPDHVVEGVYAGVYGVTHEFEDGVDWHHNPTKEREDVEYTVEWQEQLNRHYQWVQLADAYEETGDARYAEAWERELRSWIEQCPRPSDSGNTTEEPSAWRTIATGIRAGTTWPYAFETFRRSDHVSDEALWLFVCAMREHGQHLLHYPTGFNFKTMESNGLVHAGGMFPELRNARAFYVTGIDRAVAELERQFYPDGQHGELAPSYGGVSIVNTYAALRLAEYHLERWGGVPGGVGYAQSTPDTCDVPNRTWERLCDVVESYGRLAAPDGYCPPLHDSPPFPVEEMYEEVDAIGYGRDLDPAPWTGTRSVRLPWAGYAVARSEDRYALLDAGPYGAGHQHDDALQFLAFGHGEWLCVDPGKPRYDGSDVTRHVRSSAGHNVVQIDGRRHHDDPRRREVDEPFPLAFETTDDATVAAARRQFATHEAGVGFEHERVALDVDSMGWLVLDRLRPADEDVHAWEWLWHTPVDDVTVDGTGATAVHDDGPSLRIEAAGTVEVGVDCVEGRREPALRGWTTDEETSDPEPLPVIRAESGAVAGEVRLASLLVPARTADHPGADLEADLEGEWAVRAETGAGDYRVTFEADEEVDALSYRLPDGTRGSLSLAPHGTDRPSGW